MLFLHRLLRAHYMVLCEDCPFNCTFSPPAKGVGWGNWREGSNPSFSATKRAFERVLFLLYKTVLFVIYLRIELMYSNEN